MKLDELSSDLIEVIGICLESQNLAKLLFYTSSKPLQEAPITTSEIAPFGRRERILPYPFDLNYKADQRSQLHIYFPSLEFKNNTIVEDTLIWFDIVVHKKLWLILDDTRVRNEKKIRPYEIAKEIANLTNDYCHLLTLNHLAVNEEYDALRLEARIRNFTKSK
jgi:hypothetical protein